MTLSGDPVALQFQLSADVLVILRSEGAAWRCMVFVGRNDIVERTAKSPLAAGFTAGRAFWREPPPSALHFRGKQVIDALERVVARVAGLIVHDQPDLPAIALARAAAAACGCNWPASISAIKKDHRAILSEWVSLAEDRLAALRAAREAEVAAGPVGRAGVRYRLLMADPPWMYNDNGSRMSAQHQGYYQYATDHDVAALGPSVRGATAPDSILLLWVTNTVLVEGRHRRICDAWGYEPKQLVPWIKTTQKGDAVRYGGGHYTRVCSEEILACTRGQIDLLAEDGRLILAVRGKAAGLVRARDVAGVVIAPRPSGEELAGRPGHSSKPSRAYDMAEALVPGGPYLEMFARSGRRGWDAWGAQAPQSEWERGAR